MGCGIYKITNTQNNKVYIGSSLNLSNREYKHFWMLDKGKHDNVFLQKSYNKHGKNFFTFEIIENCNPEEIVERENFYIEIYNSTNDLFGYNLAKVNEFRRNTYNQEVKVKLSKVGLGHNGNFVKFRLTSTITNISKEFNNLVEAANYLIESGYTKGKPQYVRVKLSHSLRMKKINNGFNGSIRKTCYKHKFEIIE